MTDRLPCIGSEYLYCVENCRLNDPGDRFGEVVRIRSAIFVTNKGSFPSRGDIKVREKLIRFCARDSEIYTDFGSN